MPDELKGPFGILAGSGCFVLECAKEAKRRGLKLCVVAHLGETDAEIEKLADQTLWIKLGQFNKPLRFFRQAGVTQAILVGGISKIRVFGGLSLDWTAVKIFARLRSFRDDVLLRGVAEEIEKNGIKIMPASLLLPHCVAKPGYITKRKLSEQEKADALVGWEAAHTLGALDIGQTVVVLDRVVVALEGIEGTDKTILRAGELAHPSKQNLVVVKLCKPQQDTRFDLPSVGIKTIETMQRARVSALVLEAGKALIDDPEAFARAADAAGIAVLAAAAKSEIS